MGDLSRQMAASVRQLSEGLLPAQSGPFRKVPAVPVLKRDSDSEYEWSELARLVLEAEIQDNILNMMHEERIRQAKERAGEDWKEPEVLPDSMPNMRALAGRLGCHLEELLGVKAGINELEWEQKRWERIVRLESVRDKFKSWNELEAIAVRALIDRVEAGRIVDESALLAIANTAARVTQVTQNGSGSGPGGSQVNVQINQIGVNPQGDLPGPGNLGPITLTLSHRVVGQLKQNREQSDGSYLESIEMLGVKDVPGLTKTIDGEVVE